VRVVPIRDAAASVFCRPCRGDRQRGHAVHRDRGQPCRGGLSVAARRPPQTPTEPRQGRSRTRPAPTPCRAVWGNARHAAPPGLGMKGAGRGYRDAGPTASVVAPGGQRTLTLWLRPRAERGLGPAGLLVSGRDSHLSWTDPGTASWISRVVRPCPTGTQAAGVASPWAVDCGRGGAAGGLLRQLGLGRGVGRARTSQAGLELTGLSDHTRAPRSGRGRRRVLGRVAREPFH
jgi:hypothetical protein